MRRKKKLSKPLLFAAAAAVLLASVLCLFLFAKVKNTECSSQFGECPKEIADSLEKVRGKSVFPAKKEIEKTLNQKPLILDFSLQYQVPSTIAVDIVVRKPAFALGKKDKSGFALVDPEGKVILIASKTALPTVYIDGTLPNEGEYASSKLKNALELQYGTYVMNQVKEGEIEEESLAVELEEGVRVIFPLDEEVDLLLGKLRAIWTKISKEGHAYREIDLRFRNPILR